MMSLKLTPPLSLLCLLMGSGFVVPQEWSVTYTPSYICALKGSTVIMGCSYTHPHDYTVQRVFWSRELVIDKEPPDLLLDPKYSGRVQYLGDTQSDCSLRLSGVTEQDQGKYYFRFITTTSTGKYQGRDGIQLSVTELQVEMNLNRVLDGNDVTLTCKTTCSLSGPLTFIWYKHASPLSVPSNPLHLRSVSKRDAGSYSCAVEGQSYRSPAVTLDVQYPPKNVSVSISPSGGIAKGSSVTLTCSSDANPPVQNYTWYKVNASSPVGSGQSYSLMLNSNSSGWFYCVAQNKYGTRRAAAVPLTLNGSRSLVLYVVFTVIGGCGCLFAMISVLYTRKKRRGGSADDGKSDKTGESSPPDDTYTALDLQTRSSSEVYHTLANVCTSPSDDTYTTLDLQTRTSIDVHHTLATVHSSPSDDTYISLDCPSLSPDYYNMPSARKEKGDLQP